MCTVQEQLLCRLQEPQLALRSGNGVEFAIGVKLVGGVVGVKDRAKKGRHIGFEPYLGRCFVTARTSAYKPIRAIDNAPFPSQIYNICVDTSRNLHIDADVNARERVEATAMASVLLASIGTTCIPVASVPDLPLGCFREPGGVVFDRVGQGVDICGKRRRRRGVNTRNVVVGAELCEGMSSRRFPYISTRTSFVALFPVLLTTWHRSGGPSSRNVAMDASDLALFRVNCTRT